MVKLKLHDGMTVAYAHLEKVLVEKGKTVAKGDVLGSTGCTGRTTGSHLHLAMRNANDELVDPLDYVKSADDILKPSPEQIPDEITSEACRRGFFLGRGRRVGGSGQGLGAMGNYQFPTIPVWPGK